MKIVARLSRLLRRCRARAIPRVSGAGISILRQVRATIEALEPARARLAEQA